MRALRAVVTGGSRGIGRATAVCLTEAGYDVTIVGRNDLALEAAVGEGIAARFFRFDVTANGFADELASRGPFDILINNAGGAESAPFRRTSREMFRRMFALNVESAAEAARACLPTMLANGFGRIVNVASVAALEGFAYVSAYVAAKHALLGLTRALAVELAGTGVTVNAVCPGYTDTDLVARGAEAAAAATKTDPQAVRAQFAAANRSGRLVQPVEVASAVLAFLGRDAAGVTGQHVVVDGGSP